MMWLLILYLIYIAAIYCLRYLPELLYGLVAEVIWPLMKFLGRIVTSVLMLIERNMTLAGRGIWAVLIFLYYLADEALRSEEDPEDTETEIEDNSYETALRLLGLQEDYSQKEFTLAFRSAMLRAHPDKGGTDEQAQAIYEARNIVKNHNGWR